MAWSIVSGRSSRTKGTVELSPSTTSDKTDASQCFQVVPWYQCAHPYGGTQKVAISTHPAPVLVLKRTGPLNSPQTTPGAPSTATSSANRR